MNADEAALASRSPGPDRVTLAEFVRIWAAHDEWPGDETRANRMEAASAKVAADLGITTNALRDLLAAARRFGLDREPALRVVRFAATLTAET